MQLPAQQMNPWAHLAMQQQAVVSPMVMSHASSTVTSPFQQPMGTGQGSYMQPMGTGWSGNTAMSGYAAHSPSDLGTMAFTNPTGQSSFPFGTSPGGYAGNGGLAIIDPASAKKVADIRLSVHPEAFQLEPGGNRIFVNIPRAQAIAVVDRQSGKQTATWPMRVAGGNFPMALDPVARHVLVAFRSPGKANGSQI